MRKVTPRLPVRQTRSTQFCNHSGCALAGKIGMKITIKGTNIELSNSIYEYINAKIDTLEKFVQNVGEEIERGRPPIECWVEVEKLARPKDTGNIFRAEAQIKLPGVSGIRAEASEWDLYLAIDKAREALERQLKRYKRRMVTKRRR